MTPLRTSLGKTLPWALMSLVLLLHGCLTIEENYVFKKDGSGTMEYVFDASEMGKLLKGFPGSEDDKDGPKENDLGAKLGALRTIPGIDKVKYKKEQEGWVQRMSFRFADITALNAALNELVPDSSAAAPHEYFRWEGSTLVRTTGYETGDMSSMGGSGDSATAILKQMRYTFDLRFADELGEVSVAEGMTKEPDGTKRVKLGTDWSVIKDDPSALDMRITLKK